MIGFLLSILILIASLLPAGCTASKKPPAGGEAAKQYVPAAQCQGCHAAIFAQYGHTGMGQSFAAASRLLGTAGGIVPGRFQHAASGRRYEVFVREQKLFQRRYEVQADGREIQSFALEATHVTGSGNHARTFLHRSAHGEWIELPLTWYTQEKRWAMSPGFDVARPPDFERIVDERCLFCHNAYPPPDGKVAEGIDCQRCHGPGSLHVARASSGKASREDVAAAIVNPARLEPDRKMDVCLQCHLETTSSELPSMIRRFERAPYSFQPGESLSAYGVYFDDDRTDKFEVVSHAYRLRQSRCFLESKPQLTCVTCHNPHRIDRGPAAVEQMRERCRECHRTIQAKAHPDPARSDCTSCHMPKRRTEDAVHVVMTDHKIERRPRALEPLAGNRRQGRPELYGTQNLSPEEADVYRGVALISGNADRRAGISILERSKGAALSAKAAAVLGEAYFADGRWQDAERSFRRALSMDGNLVRARYNLARALEAAGRVEEARSSYLEATASEQLPEAEYAFANFLVRSGQSTLAEARYRNAVRLRPVYAAAHGNLGALLADTGRMGEALSELQLALSIDPTLDDAHNNLARVLSAQGNQAQALAHLQKAAALNPGNLAAGCNYAQLLHQTGATAQSIAQYRRILAAHPGSVEAHVGLGQVLGDAGRISEAAAEFQNALQLQPGNAEARKGLDLARALQRGQGR